VSAQYTYLGVGTFTESGADSLNLRVSSYDTNSFRSYIGGRVAYAWSVTNAIRLIPEVRMFWQHEFLQDPSDIYAALDGGAGPEFFYRTSDPSRDAVFCGAGLIVQLGDHVSANAYYNADFGRSNLVYHLVSAGLEVRF
jgi:outer membrane autotransporter protein